MASTNGVITKSSSINPYIKKQISAADSVKPACSRTNLAPRNPYSKSSSSVPTLSNPQPSQTTSNEAPFPPIRKNNPYLSRKYPREYSQPSTTGSTLLLTTASQQIEIVECNEFSHSAPSGSSTSLERDAIAVKAPSLKSKEYHQTCSRIGSLEVPNSSASLSNSSLVASRMKPSIASLRPSSWTLTNSCPSQSTPIHVEPSTQSITTNRPELPGEIALPPELVYDPESIKPIKDEYRNKLTINARLNQPLLNGWTLYRHQKRAILKGLMKRRVILALDMGLGKTLIGCVWARAFKKSFDGLKIIVVCPVTLKKEWKRTAEEATGLSVEDEKHAANDSLDMAIATWAKIPLAVDPAIANFVAIFDEAHAMQSMEANRTQAALKLVFEKRCVGVLLLTGTPMKNGKPCNLFPLLKAVRHPLGLHQKAFERHFCQGRMASLGGRAPQWIASGQANLKQLHRLIEPSLLHMTKDEYLNELPPMKRETRAVPINARYQKQYKEKVKNMASLQAAMKTNMDLNNKALMGATQELRVICSFAKIGATVEIAKEILQMEPSVVIFTNFAKAATSMHKQLEDCGWQGALLTGETPAKKRQDLVDGFQQELYSVFITTFGAGGVGITLTQARTVIFLDRPWTPGELLQAEDRIRRIGQEKDTRSIWVSAFEFDSQLDSMLEEKNQASKAVLTKTGISTGDSCSSINIPKLVASLIASNATL